MALDRLVVNKVGKLYFVSDDLRRLAANDVFCGQASYPPMKNQLPFLRPKLYVTSHSGSITVGTCLSVAPT